MMTRCPAEGCDRILVNDGRCPVHGWEGRQAPDAPASKPARKTRSRK